MKTIVFQGDSITDAGRVHTDGASMGQGYPALVAASLGLDCPGGYQMYNRGVSGNRVVDLYARIKADIINLKPDILSILVGTNDVWHEIYWQNGVSAEKYYRIYSMLMEEILEALPQVKVMILEPFLLKGEVTREHLQEFCLENKRRAEKAREVAANFHALFIPLQERFDRAAETAPAEHWLYDGVHPTLAGSELIKRAWLEGMKKLGEL